MKKIIIFTTFILTTILIYKVLYHTDVELPSTEEKILEAPELKEEVLIFNDKALNFDIFEEKVEEDFKAISIEKVIEEEFSKEIKDIMIEADIEEVKEHFPIKDTISPLIAIEIEKGKISKLNIGDSISLPYMGRGEYEATIISKSIHKNGSTTITGNLNDLGKEYSFVLTEGKNMSFGTVTTPNGTFEIESKNGQGYIYSTDDIDKKWIDYNKKDTLEPHPH